MPLDTSNLKDNPWLAGFIDADGHFSVKLSGSYSSDLSEKNATIRARVKCVFSINQSEVNRINGESNIPFMTELAKFFKVNLLYKTENNVIFKKPAKKIEFYAQSDQNHSIIISYLTNYSLMSSKHLNFLSFKQASLYLGKRLSINQIEDIRLIKNNMNRKRTEFT